MSPVPNAVVAGHICVDLIPTLDATPTLEPGALIDVGPMQFSAGGCVAGTGLALAELGIETCLVADVGTDALGDVLITMLEQEGVDTAGLRRRGRYTTSYSVVVEPPTTDRSFWHHVGANATFDGSGVDLRGRSLLHLGYPTLLPALYADNGAAWSQLLEQAAALDVTTSTDLATIDPTSAAATCDWRAILTRVLPRTGLLTPSADDLVSALGIAAPQTPDEAADAARTLLDLGAAAVMVTCGPQGLLLATAGRQRLDTAGAALAAVASDWADEVHWVPALDVPQRTTRGAGDAAAAGLLAALLEGASAADAAARAAAAAAARISGEHLSHLSYVSDGARPATAQA